MKTAIVSVTNDLCTDQRVNKICLSLQKNGYDVLLVGRKLNYSQAVKRPYKTKRFGLLFNKGFLFYACYNIRLFFFLSVTKMDLLWSNDLDTLPANYLTSKIKKIPLIYDSHEYFTEVPELLNRKRVQNIWLKIEKGILPKLKNTFTVSHSIAQAYKEMYGINIQVLYNFPFYKELQTTYKINDNIILYQGSVNKNRGIEELISAMQFIDNATLLIVGSGDEYEKCRQLAEKLNLSQKIVFKGRVAFEALQEITLKATIGVSLEKADGLNYTFALPNKLFDYCHAGIPVLVSNLPEMANFVSENKIGAVLKTHNVEAIATKLNEMLHNKQQLEIWHKNELGVAKQFCWQNEEKKIDKILLDIG